MAQDSGYTLLLGLITLCQVGCTFVTNCPCADAGGTGGTGAAKGGTGGTGGTGNGSPDDGGSPGDDGEWLNVTANLTELVSGPEDTCGSIFVVSAKPGEDFLIAGVGTHGLWASTDGGGSWTALGTGKGGEPILNIPNAIVYDPENTDVFWESGIYESGIFKTKDKGDTFQRVGDVRHNDIVSVDFTDPDRQVVLAGGHEQKQTLYLSKDGGESFESIGEAIPSDAGISSVPLVLDANTFLLGCQNWGSGVTGVYRSTDQGETWSLAGEGGGVRKPLVASDGAIYWSGERGGDIYRSEDLGESWQTMTPTGAELTVAPIELPDGRIASVSRRYIVVSADRAETWQPVSPPLTFRPRSIAYLPERKAFFISHETCGGEEPPDAVLRFDFDYETQ